MEVSPTLISNVTDCVLEEVHTWQSRPLERVYPIVYFDAIVSKVRHEGKVSNRAIHMALGINLEGKKEVLGMWACPHEGAKFWLQVLTELKNRGLADSLICCVDGLAGFADAIHTVYPQVKVQLCIVHMIRNSLNFVQSKRRKQIANEIKSIYTAPTVESAEQALLHFSEKYDKEYPAISKSWQRNWQYIIPFFDYPNEIRKVIYTTNAIESLNSSLSKISRSRHLFPTQESLFKLYYLSLRNISKKWTMPIANWPQALNRFIIEFQHHILL